jgi:hypothetical protein
MNTTIIAIVAALFGLTLAIVAIVQTQHTKRLRAKFGPEYDYAVDRQGDRRKAEAELAHREDSVKRLHIRKLTHSERDHYAAVWRNEQARFIEDPRQAAAGRSYFPRHEHGRLSGGRLRNPANVCFGGSRACHERLS